MHMDTACGFVRAVLGRKGVVGQFLLVPESATSQLQQRLVSDV